MNSLSLTLFDCVVLVTLLGLAWQLLATPDLFKAMVLFMSFGLVMALAWVRLAAPDVALAEAALGAGLTGPLFLSALHRLRGTRKGERRQQLDSIEHRGKIEKVTQRTTGRIIYLLLRILFAGLFLTLLVHLATILLHVEYENPGLGVFVAEQQEESGVISPVTAVLLNFRGYDTLLEIMVLFVAVVAVWSLATVRFSEKSGQVSPIQQGVVRILAPLMILVAVSLIWQGTHLAGGAFQGGAVLAAAGVLMMVSELPWLRLIPSLPVRLMLVFGPLVFLGLGVSCLADGRFLEYPGELAGFLILLIELACGLSIGLTLACLFVGGRPVDDLVDRGQLEEGS